MAPCLFQFGLLAAPQTGPAGDAAAHRPLLDRYCAGCHNQKLKTAGLALDKADVNDPAAAPEIWEKVIRKVRGGLMPPAGMPRPDPASATNLVTYLENALDRAAQAKPNPGRALIHRLNRTEYGHAIRDLLGVNVDVTEMLPSDDAAYGFDNVADLLGVSPVLLERYLSAAWKISGLAVGDKEAATLTETHRIPPELSNTTTLRVFRWALAAARCSLITFRWMANTFCMPAYGPTPRTGSKGSSIPMCSWCS